MIAAAVLAWQVLAVQAAEKDLGKMAYYGVDVRRPVWHPG